VAHMQGVQQRFDFVDDALASGFCISNHQHRQILVLGSGYRNHLSTRAGKADAADVEPRRALRKRRQQPFNRDAIFAKEAATGQGGVREFRSKQEEGVAGHSGGSTLQPRQHALAANQPHQG
jgi:hypothetical protein